MHIWVDADACPAVIKDILFRAAERLELPLTLVANKALRAPPSRFIRTMQVSHGFDVADNEITDRIEVGDLVITADIPLASRTSQLSGRASKQRRSDGWTRAARQHGSQTLRGSARPVPDTPAEGLTADFRTRHTARAAPCRSAGAWSRRCRKWCADRRSCGDARRRSPPAWHRGIRRRPARRARARW